MEFYFAFLTKLLVMFIGGGLVSLLAVWMAKQASTIPSLIVDFYTSRAQKKNILITKCEKISSHSGIYEVFISGCPLVKLFSSHKGMKVV